MSQFDPAQFLAAQQTEVNERRANLPEENPASPDGYYTAVIGEIGHRSGTIGKGDKTGQPWMQVTVPLKIEVPQQLQDGLKLPPTLTITDGVFIDLTPEGNADNAPGRNRGQKNYRDALDMNSPGVPFGWNMTTGRPVKVKIKHELYNDQVQERIGGIFRA
jgi:hypothetical protein